MAAAKPVAPIEIDTATLAKPVGRSAHIRIGGTVFEAHCPKDAVLARIKAEAETSLDAITRIIAAMIGKAGGEQVADMLHDEDNEEVSLVTLSALVRYLLEDPDGPEWGKALTESLKELGSGETPRTVPVRRTSAPARAPKKAAKRAPARR